MDVAKYGKAIVGALIAGLTALGIALADGRITGVEWTIISIATLTTFGSVWAVPNKTDPPAPAPPGGTG